MDTNKFTKNKQTTYENKKKKNSHNYDFKVYPYH